MGGALTGDRPLLFARKPAFGEISHYRIEPSQQRENRGEFTTGIVPDSYRVGRRDTANFCENLMRGDMP